MSKASQKQKNKKANPLTVGSDGLKFMNKRDNLIGLMEDRKTKASQLAYKVT